MTIWCTFYFFLSYVDRGGWIHQAPFENAIFNLYYTDKSTHTKRRKRMSITVLYYSASTQHGIVLPKPPRATIAYIWFRLNFHFSHTYWNMRLHTNIISTPRQSIPQYICVETLSIQISTTIFVHIFDFRFTMIFFLCVPVGWCRTIEIDIKIWPKFDFRKWSKQRILAGIWLVWHTGECMDCMEWGWG